MYAAKCMGFKRLLQEISFQLKNALVEGPLAGALMALVAFQNYGLCVPYSSSVSVSCPGDHFRGHWSCVF